MDERHAPQVGCRRETRQVADHATSQRDYRFAAFGAPLHQPIVNGVELRSALAAFASRDGPKRRVAARAEDRKSTRLNSSHQIISYAVFCLKKKKKNTTLYQI